MTLSNLNDLAARVEALTGPDREIDFEILCVVDSRAIKSGPLPGDPQFTKSIDAAMTLVPGNCTLISLSELEADGLALARVGRPDLEDVPIFKGISTGAMVDTPVTVQLALALTAAALRSRVQGED